MKFTPVWNRHLHQAINRNGLIVEERFIYVTERGQFLTKLEVLTGKELWTVKTGDAWGWLLRSESKLYYLTQSGTLLEVNIETAEISKISEEEFYYPGYIIRSKDFFITGGWRGYSDLVCYNSALSRKLWTKDTSSQSLIDFSIPYIIRNKLLFTVNHSSKRIIIYELISGELKAEMELPKNIGCPDLGRSYQIIDGRITFVSWDGKIYTLADDFRSLHCEDLNVDCVSTNLPLFDGENILFEDGNSNCILYRRSDSKILWQIKIENNFKTNIFACKLMNECYLVGGSTGQLSIVDEEGIRRRDIKSERRITTGISRINDLIVLCTKSDIKVLSFNE